MAMIPTNFTRFGLELSYYYLRWNTMVGEKNENLPNAKC